MNMKIGFIGLGVMGKPMAKNLLEAGYPLTVWNRIRSKMDELLSLGAKGADSPKGVAENSDVVVTVVSDSADVEKVVLGPSGVIEAARSGLVLIDMSIISPHVEREIPKKLSEKNARMLDAPVRGGEIGAKKGTLSIMVGGSRAVYEECLPILQVLGKKIVYIGENGLFPIKTLNCIGKM
jgi:2-hydroxy-3-oxopropionate reductase